MKKDVQRFISGSLNFNFLEFNRRTKKYNSYKETIGTVVHNLLNRRFKTDQPFQKIVNDVTEARWGNQTINERLVSRRSDLLYCMTVHSDQGIHYQKCLYVNILRQAHAFQNMSHKAMFLDNAVVESSLHILKFGTVYNYQYKNYKELKTAITSYVDYYNHRQLLA